MRRLLSLLCLALVAADKPFSPTEAPKHMTLPPGFQVSLFAGEPDVVQPIAFTFDDRGRLWVAECLSYPNWQRDGKPGHDRIVIFEDTDGDGKFDKRTVFADNIANLSGIELGFGGVWACATPNLLFIPDRNGDDIPDGPPEVVLDGWSLDAKHNVFNDLVWGPDGWLYGCNGILATSSIGKPGMSADKRVAMNCGVWRYHPTRQTFEIVCTGTTNPWGLDFDEWGEGFITNCVIHHLWHVIPGAHFERMYGQDFNPFYFALMKSPADHIHWGGGPWTSSRGGQGVHSEAGGGHAHVGCMVYLGDNWPDAYRGGLFTCNLHGNRVNHDRLERHGSGYVARHEKDFLLANDPWFRGITIRYGPDGGVFVSDWTDTGECHNYEQVDRANGRIYKVTYGTPHAWHGDLAKLADAELVQLLWHKNDWFGRHARRLLQERAVAGKLGPQAAKELRAVLDDERADVRRRLRALWTLHAIGALAPEKCLAYATEGDEHLRVWALRLFGDAIYRTSGRYVQLLEKVSPVIDEKSPPALKLAFASVAQRCSTEWRTDLVTLLLRSVTEADDLNLPLMTWYAAEPAVAARPSWGVTWLDYARVPLVRQYIARRLALLPAGGLDELLGWLARSKDAGRQLDVLQGMQAALQGVRDLPRGKGWDAAYAHLSASASERVREETQYLAVRFGDQRAVAALRGTLRDRHAPAGRRAAALQALLQRRPADLVGDLKALADDPEVRGPVIRGLAAYADLDIPALLLRDYPRLPETDRADVVQTLASRPAFARALLDAVERKVVPRRDVSAFTIRQLQGFKDPAINERISRVWGTIRPASQERVALTAKYKAILTPEALKQADPSHGRAVFARTCASCHRLFGEGTDVGPDLTGSQRMNLDYVLENVLDPSAVVYSEYQVTVVETNNGRVINGIVKQETDRALTLRTQNEEVIVPKDEVASRTKSPLSLMPEGLFTTLKDDEVRDLVAYLASPMQVPLPNGP